MCVCLCVCVYVCVKAKCVDISARIATKLHTRTKNLPCIFFSEAHWSEIFLSFQPKN